MHPNSSFSCGCLETLALNLLLGSRDGCLCVGVDKSAALLAVLELGADAGADAGALAVVGAAALLAIGIGDATSRSELAALAVSDVTGTSGVGDGLSVDGGSEGQDSEESDADHFGG